MSGTAKEMLDLAARLALRAAGHVEPHPLVGAVVVSQGGRIIGLGHHRRFGGPHAEREALADCRRRGEDPRGATMYVTLEPCAHHGKTPPCTDAVIEAGIARVVAARRDPNPISANGAALLVQAGVAVELVDDSPLATSISDPFIKRVATGLPWVIAKWAQFEDGRMVTRPGEPRWISNELCRRRVHRLRARVDAIVTGIGTVLADDPTLTVRGVLARRKPIRVVLDPSLRTPLDSAPVRTAREVRTVVVCGEIAADGERATGLRGHGITIVPTERSAPGESFRSVLGHLARQESVANVLIESGPTLLGVAMDAGLIDEAITHTAPGKAGAKPTREERAPDFRGFEVCRVRRYGGTEERVLRRPRAGRSSTGR